MLEKDYYKIHNCSLKINAGTNFGADKTSQSGRLFAHCIMNYDISALKYGSWTEWVYESDFLL